jgi:hypothetical protein
MDISMSVDAFKAGFFDRKAVQTAVGKVQGANLSKGGAFVRRAAKTSLKYRKQEQDAPAGRPPFVHRSEKFTLEKTNKRTGVKTRRASSPLRELLFFAFDTKTKTVVIGPAGLNKGAGQTVPEVQEDGGTVKVRRVIRQVRGRARSRAQAEAYKRLVASGAITPPPRPKALQTVTIKPHPYMRPALAKEIAAGKIAAVWKDTIKAGT